MHNKNKSCRFCADTTFKIDYKNGNLLARYLSEGGKILPRHLTGNCADHQKEITLAIKRGREIGILHLS